MRECFISPAKDTSKGRTFRALCLATVEADGLWSGGYSAGDTIRPVWAMFCGSDGELRPFMANLQTGRKGEFPKGGFGRKGGDKIEILKSAKFQAAWQKETEGSIATTFLPDLFRLDPGMVDPNGINFVLLPTVEWAKSQTLDVAPIIEHGLRVLNMREWKRQIGLDVLVPIGYLFAAYLDRRTRCPLLADGRFYLQILLASLDQGLASLSCEAQRSSYYHREDPENWGKSPRLGFREIGTSDVGMLPGIAFSSNHSDIEKLLAEQATLFEKVTSGVK